MGQIFAHLTCTRVMWEQDEEGFTFPEPVEEHGWVDRRWNARVLYDSRNDVGPVMSLDERDPELMEEVREVLDWLPGGYEDNGDGTFYAKADDSPFDDPWSYSYAVHFTWKFLGLNGWVEVPWVPPLD